MRHACPQQLPAPWLLPPQAGTSRCEQRLRLLRWLVNIGKCRAPALLLLLRWLLWLLLRRRLLWLQISIAAAARSLAACLRRRGRWLLLLLRCGCRRLFWGRCCSCCCSGRAIDHPHLPGALVRHLQQACS